MNGLPESIQLRMASTKLCRARCAMQSPNAPTPGKIIARHKSSWPGAEMISASSSKNLQALETLPRFPMP